MQISRSLQDLYASRWMPTLAALLLLCAIYGLWWLWTRWRGVKGTRPRLFESLRRTPKDDPAREPLKVLTAALRRTLIQLRGSRAQGGRGRWMESRRHLYDLPWFMIIGSPGVGKTAALLGAGLQFPMAPRAGRASAPAGRTPQAEWWLTNDAVLIDTAGRYTSQDGDPLIDPAEWRGLLRLLRRHRTHAPLNGVVVALGVDEVRAASESARSAHACRVRERLAELRQVLGIRFPVYVVVTKSDLLRGFGEYFQSLTSEGRAQPWGFTLPLRGTASRTAADTAQPLCAQVDAELALLAERLAAGLRARFSEEFDVERRKRLFALPREMAELSAPLAAMLDEIFLVSRFDRTQAHGSLRGVYFTSAAQPDAGSPALQSRQPFFLHDVWRRVIVPEAHLVRPNLRWEFRLRVLRWAGHTLAIAVFAGLALALALSHGHNRAYLAMVTQRAGLLDARVRSLFAAFTPAGVPDALNAARELPTQAGLDVDDPPVGFRYGLYSAPPVRIAARETYAQLQGHALLPIIVRRMEAVLAQSVKDGDARAAYETLRVYKLLNDSGRYMNGGANDVRQWVLRDWETSDSAAVFGARAAMVGHAGALFSGERPVQSATLPDEALVRTVRDFLDARTSAQRVYERARTSMLPEAPQEFSLVRAVGPQAGTVFARAGNQPLEKGVPGLFTLDGYHDVFARRLPGFVSRAFDDDAWVMGRAAPGGEASLLEDIRRQYLDEYAQRWTNFLGSIRTVASADANGAGLGFDLAVLRQLAAPDSPLARLARAAARETTLSRMPATRPPQQQEEGVATDSPLEKELVDNRFAALREVVTGQPDADAAAPGMTAARPGLESISALLNEFYTVLVVADSALAAGGLPPGGTEVGARLKLEAGKLPAPFHEVLGALAASGGDKVVAGATGILHEQARQQLDRLMGRLALQVGEPCRRGLAGRYPLAAVAQDASIDDFNTVFSAGGAADEFFATYLAAYVDTGVRPWRYKEAAVATTVELGAAAPAAVAPTGPTQLGELLKLLAQSGPKLDFFYRARQVRELFFREAGGKRLAWKIDLRVLELEPGITDLLIDIDGQSQRYIHGPVQPLAVVWPGPRGGATAEITAHPRVSVSTSTMAASGPWALLRLLERGHLVGTATPGRLDVEFSFDGRKALIEIGGGSQPNPLDTEVLKGIQCPGEAA